MNCDPKSLAINSSCFCFPTDRKRGALIFLLCQWLKQNEPVAQFSYEPETEVIQWTTLGVPHSGNLAAFYSDPNWPLTTDITIGIALIDSISGLYSLPLLSIFNGSGLFQSGPSTIDFTGCSNLTWADCSNGPGVISIILTGCTSLQHLDFNNSSVNSIDLNDCSSLTWLDCHGGGGTFTSLDISPCPLISYVNCSSNSFLSTLTLTGCTALTTLDCSNCSLNTFDVSTCTALSNLNCSGNSLTTLTVTGCTSLANLFCSSNALAALDVSTCTALSNLNCSGNSLTTLTVTGCTSLANLFCSSNALAALDVSTCTALSNLFCDSNSLTGAAMGDIFIAIDASNPPAGNNGAIGVSPQTTGDGIGDLTVGGLIAYNDLNGGTWAWTITIDP